MTGSGGSVVARDGGEPVTLLLWNGLDSERIKGEDLSRRGMGAGRVWVRSGWRREMRGEEDEDVEADDDDAENQHGIPGEGKRLS
jgi:hypothetical protein